MKKITIFLILILLLILLISCGNSTSNTSCETTTTATEPSPAVSTTQPTTTKTPITTKAPITSTSKATETQPTTTSETIETDPTVINSGFSTGSGFKPCPLYIDYEMPKSCPLSEETISITLYFGLEENYLTLDYVKPEESFDITFGWGDDILYHHRIVTVTEIEKEKYFVTREGQDLVYSHSETIELPLSIFTEKAENLYWYAYYVKQDEICGYSSAMLSYQKTDEGTIVFYPHHLPLPTPNH